MAPNTEFSNLSPSPVSAASRSDVSDEADSSSEYQPSVILGCCNHIHEHDIDDSSEDDGSDEPNREDSSSEHNISVISDDTFWEHHEEVNSDEHHEVNRFDPLALYSASQVTAYTSSRCNRFLGASNTLLYIHHLTCEHTATFVTATACSSNCCIPNWSLGCPGRSARPLKCHECAEESLIKRLREIDDQAHDAWRIWDNYRNVRRGQERRPSFEEVEDSYHDYMRKIAEEVYQVPGCTTTMRRD